MVEKGQKFPPEGEGLPDTALQQKDPAGRHRQDSNALDAAGSGKQPAGTPAPGPARGEGRTGGGSDDGAERDEDDRPGQEDAPPPGEDATKDMDDPNHVPGP